MNKTPKYKRVLLKLSGEALSAGGNGIINRDFVHEVSAVLKKCLEEGVQIAIIVGAGNIWRGRQGEDMDAARADYMGMLATAINSIALQDVFISDGIDAHVMTAIEMSRFSETFNRDAAVRHFENGGVVIFGCGLGTPFMSTDTAAVVRAAEIGADIVLMAKNIDGIYTADPKKDPSAKKLNEITYKDMLARGLAALDSTATSFCMDKNMPILAFGLSDPENIYRAVMGENVGTIVHA